MPITLPNHWSPRAKQEPLWDYLRSGGKRAAVCWHRRFGKDDVSLHFTAIAAHERVGSYWHLLPEQAQARKAIWTQVNPHTGLRRIDEAFPLELRRRTNDQEMFIEFLNGSTWQIAGSDNYNSLVGSSPCGIVFSEYALSNPASWAYLRPILRENGGWAIFISTPRGKNHFYHMVELAKSEPGWFTETLTVDDTQALDPMALAADLRELQAEHGETYGRSIWMQENYCVPPGTRVWTSHGQRPIEHIQVGETVLSHTGRWRSVTKTFTQQVSEPLISIQTTGSPCPLSLTGNHRVRTCHPSTQTYRWVPAREIAVGDWLVLPRLKPSVPVISAELAEVIGWYLAEGSQYKNGVQFSLGGDEQAFAERLMVAGRSWGVPVCRRTATGLAVQIPSTALADFLRTHCGTGAEQKRIPWTLITGHEQLLYQALMDGDGCRGEDTGVQHVYTTISESLAFDMQLLAHQCGYRASITHRPSPGQQVILGRTCTVRDSYSVRITITKQSKTARQDGRKILPQKHGIAVRVSVVSQDQYCGPVHNLGVSVDESYVANGRVVHNCSFDAAIPGAFYADSLDRLQLQGQIVEFDHDPAQSVFTAWDLGRTDDTAIWFYQFRGREIDIIDYWAKSGCEISHPEHPESSLVHVLLDKAKQFGYRYAQHWLPHDARPRKLGMGGKSILQQFHDARLVHPTLGSFAIVPKLDVQEGIQAARKTFQYVRFHQTRCALGLQALRHYHRTWDAEKKMYQDHPVHDWSSHGADAWRYLSLSWRPAKARIPESGPWTPSLAGPTWGSLVKKHLEQKRREREWGPTA